MHGQRRPGAGAAKPGEGEEWLARCGPYPLPGGGAGGGGCRARLAGAAAGGAGGAHGRDARGAQPGAGACRAGWHAMSGRPGPGLGLPMPGPQLASLRLVRKKEKKSSFADPGPLLSLPLSWRPRALWPLRARPSGRGLRRSWSPRRGWRRRWRGGWRRRRSASTRCSWRCRRAGRVAGGGRSAAAGACMLRCSGVQGQMALGVAFANIQKSPLALGSLFLAPLLAGEAVCLHCHALQAQLQSSALLCCPRLPPPPPTVGGRGALRGAGQRGERGGGALGGGGRGPQPLAAGRAGGGGEPGGAAGGHADRAAHRAAAGGAGCARCGAAELDWAGSRRQDVGWELGTQMWCLSWHCCI